MQSRVGSLVESLVNIVVGYGIAVLAQTWIFAQLGIPISIHNSLIVGAFMTVVSIVRSYVLRRLFNKFTFQVTKNATRN